MANPDQDLRSNTIYKGTELLLALIESEKAKAVAIARQEFERGSQLAEARKVCVEPLTDAPNVDVATLPLNTELAEVKRDLGQLTAALAKVGIYYSNGDAKTLKFHGEWDIILRELERKPEETATLATDDTRSGTQTEANSSIDPSFVLRTLREQLERNRLELARWEEKCRTLEEERDGFKRAVEGALEVARLVGPVLQDTGMAPVPLPDQEGNVVHGTATDLQPINAPENLDKSLRPPEFQSAPQSCVDVSTLN